VGRVQWDAAISSFGKARDGQGGVDKAIGGAERGEVKRKVVNKEDMGSKGPELTVNLAH